MQMENKSIDPAMMDVLRQAGDGNDQMNYADFVRIVAFDASLGYYAKTNDRVGHSGETDFFTAESLGTVFGKLIVAASIQLLGSEKAAKQHVFVEIGPEPGKSILDDVEHPFAETMSLRLQDALLIPKQAMVFANEWLDSLPFHRLRFDKQEGWQELGVQIGSETLDQITLPALTPAITSIEHRLPVDTQDDYRIDISVDAIMALREIARQNWQGAFLTFDYGKSWPELIQNHPNGTARAYERHRAQGGDLLSNPGHTDLTCHLCWDFLKEVLDEEGFHDIAIERQESFLMKRASSAIRKIVEKQTDEPKEESQTLRELLHPSLMGDAFQALSAKRPRLP